MRTLLPNRANGCLRWHLHGHAERREQLWEVRERLRSGPGLSRWNVLHAGYVVPDGTNLRDRPGWLWWDAQLRHLRGRPGLLQRNL